MNRFLPNDLATSLALQLTDSGVSWTYDDDKHRLLIWEEESSGRKEESFSFRLPITLPPPDEKGIFHPEEVHYVVVLIQSGQCALGLFEGLENLNHKVIRAYMVRKKQGKSQVKYLKTKGKSRAGSRVRLAGTVEFFEQINERLQAYFQEQTIDRIAFSCSKTLLPYFFNSRVAPPFTKKDERIIKIPRHVHTPTFEELMEVQRFLARGELLFEEEKLPVIEHLLSGFSGKQEGLEQ